MTARPHLGPPPLTLAPSAQRNEPMLTSVTRDQSSHRRALKAASSRAQSAFVHGLQPQRVVLQRYDSHPLSGRCCSILSAIRTATRCSSEFNSTCHQTGAHPVQLRHAVLRPSRPNDHLRAPRARIRLDPPGSAFRLVVSTTSHSPPQSLLRLTGLHWPSRMRHRVLWLCRSLRRVIKTVHLSLSWRFVVQSLRLLSVLTSFNENPPACTASSLPSAMMSLP